MSINQFRKLKKILHGLRKKLEKKADKFARKYEDDTQENNAEWFNARKELKMREKSWRMHIEEKRKLIEWMERTNDQTRKQAEEEFTRLKRQVIDYWNKRYYIEEKNLEV